MPWIEQWLKWMCFLPLKPWQETTRCMVSRTDVTWIVARPKEWSLYKSEPKYKHFCLPVESFIRQILFFFKTSLTTPITVSYHIFTWLIPYCFGCRVKKTKQVITCILPILCHWVINWKCASNHRGRVAHAVNKQVAVIYRWRQPTSDVKLLSCNFEGQNMWRKLSQVI